jgi:ribosomal protein S18 acetylase RimI-like enzyme
VNRNLAADEERHHFPLADGRAFAQVEGTRNGDATLSISLTGVVLRVRELTGGDLSPVERHFLRLAPPDRRARFGGNRADQAIRAYARGLDPSRVILVGAFDPDGHLVGLAEAHPAGTTAEVAVSIDAAFRKLGLGRSLVSHGVALAFGRGVQFAEFVFSPDNRAIVRLVQTLGGRTIALGRMSVGRTEQSAR